MNIVEITKESLMDRVRWVYEAYIAVEALEKLPIEIKKLEGTYDVSLSGVHEITLWGGAKTMEVCTRYGATFDKPKFQSHSGKFMAEGKFGNVVVKVFNIPPPKECLVMDEPYVAHRYKAICGDTGEEIK